jgi:TonB family protein
METLHLSLCGPSPGAPTEAHRGDCANGSVHLLLIPTPRLPASRFFQGLAVNFVVFLVVMAITWFFGKVAAQQPTLNSARLHDNPIQIVAYDPRPARKQPPDVSLSRVERDEGRRFSPSPKTIQSAAAPALGQPPTVIETRADLVPQIPEKGLPLPVMPAPAILQARMGSPEAPAAPVPNLAPSPHRAAAFRQHGPNVGPDPLGLGRSTAPLFGHSSGAEGTGGGPPDLSAKPPRAAQREQLQLESEAFTKPEISVMPKPMYPPTALAARIEGDVILQVTFDKSGRVIFRRVIRQLQSAEMNFVARETVERIKFLCAMAFP